MPHALTPAEWNEIAQMPAIRESWGLQENEGGEALSPLVYAAKFNFVSGSPGYVGELFVLQGDTLTGDAPFVLVRSRDGQLMFADDE